MTTKVATMVPQRGQAAASLLKVNVALALAKTNIDLPRPAELVNDNVIVTGTKHKILILHEYGREFGSNNPDSIVTRKKGKKYHNWINNTPAPMSLSVRKYYWVQELTLYNVITTVIKEYRDSFDSTDVNNLSRINGDFSTMIPNPIRWLQLDFSPLREPRYSFESQTKISSRQVEMASAAMIKFGPDPGKFVHWQGGKYTGKQ